MSPNCVRRTQISQRAVHALLLLAALLGAVTSFRASAETSEAAGAVVPEGYRIAAEDVLDVSVWKETDLQRKVIVRPDGGISFPLVGDVQAAGLTPAELEDALKSRLSAFIPDAVVTVSVIELRGLRIYVTGNVRNPGQFEVGRYVDVLQAITLAGGFTPFADPRNVQIIRRENGREIVYDFDYKDVQQGRDLKQNIMLKADDVVLVP